MADLLRAAGWRVVWATGDGGEGFSLALSRRPRLVVMDLALPGLGGIELLRRIRAALPSCRVVVCSALVQASWIQAAVEMGAADFVVKPIEEKRFLAAVGVPLAPGAKSTGIREEEEKNRCGGR